MDSHVNKWHHSHKTEADTLVSVDLHSWASLVHRGFGQGILPLGFQRSPAPTFSENTPEHLLTAQTEPFT